MRILHLTADFPDPLMPSKTPAVANLLEIASARETAHTHRIVSLNRVDWRAGLHAIDFAGPGGPAHRALAYGAPGKGLFLRRFLQRVADWVAQDCAAAGFAPDLIHAHKISIEGIVGANLAERWGIPFVVSVQGNTDLKIVGLRRDLRRLYAKIWRDAAVAFPFAPWARSGLDRLLGVRMRPVTLLPCPTPADALIPPVLTKEPVVSTAFNFRDAANKNVTRLIRATARAAVDIPDIRLEIIGGGDPAAFAAMAGLANEVAPGRVHFIGSVPNTQIQRRFNASTAFAMVSHRESYGMVFAEALLAGTPCLFPRDRAIGGYFKEGSVVLAADPKDEAEIARNLVRLVQEERSFKARLAELGASGGLEFMTRPAIRDSYLGALATIGRV